MFEVFNILESINNYKNITPEKLCLARLKVINCLWELDINHKNIIIGKILRFIDTNNIDQVLRLNWIDENTQKELGILEKKFTS